MGALEKLREAIDELAAMEPSALGDAECSSSPASSTGSRQCVHVAASAWAGPWGGPADVFSVLGKEIAA